MEDYITPESEEALLKLLEMMDRIGVRGTFKLVGEKTRVMREHNREDIFDMIKRHEIGYHTNFHSKHPLIVESLEPLGFKDGAVEFERREMDGFKDLVEITGMKPTTYGQPGSDWTPQVFPVLRKWGISVYLDVHDLISFDKKPFWFGGLINFTDIEVIRMELSDDGLERAKKEFDILYNRLSNKGTSFISIYYHPCEFITLDFWDKYNFSRGVNTPKERWVKPPLRTKEEMEFYIGRLEEFINYILSKKDTEFITASESLRYEGKEPMTRDEIRNLSDYIGDQLYFYKDDKRSLSPSEIFSLFCQFLNKKEPIPELIYGPENDIPTKIGRRVKVSEIIEAVNTSYPDIFGYKQLPDFFLVEGEPINPVDMTCTLAKIIREGLTEEDEVEVVKGNLKTSIHVSDNNNFGRRWIIFPEDFKAPNIVRIAKLQTWTLKPVMA